MAGLVRLTWTGDAPPGTSSVAARLRAEGVEPHQWSNGPGERYATHSHGYTKVLMCAAGSITFLVGAAGGADDAEGAKEQEGEGRAAVELRAGEGFVLPAGTPHAAIVGWEGCTCLEGSR